MLKSAPSPWEYDLIWKQNLCRSNQIETRSYWARVGHNSKTDELIKREKERGGDGGTYSRTQRHTENAM